MQKAIKIATLLLFVSGAVFGIYYHLERSRTVREAAKGLQQESRVHPAVAPAPRAALGAALHDLAGRLSAPGADAIALLADLRSQLSTATTNDATTELRRFLDSGKDAATGRGFKIGNAGFLDEAPTLRTWLLDYLGRIDPQAAADYARVVLSSKRSADEWAIALRCLAMGDTTGEGHALLAQKTGELLAEQTWQQNPSAGYLEAFDTAVYLGGTNLLPSLTDLVRKKDNPAVAHAAYLTLDRLTINQPRETLAALLNSPGLMAGREDTRANYFARIDSRDPAQRQVLETYLLLPEISAAELDRFAAIYPNANYMVSLNLLTPVATPDREWLVGRDEAALQAVNEWLADPRFARAIPQLNRIRQRLETFMRQANAGN
jgi:hypothetical protein